MSSKSSEDTRTRILQTTWQLMEQQPGEELSMNMIARATGISRQALYLHFTSRTELMIATSNFVDEAKGLNKRLLALENLSSGTEFLITCIEIWGNYIPEIYALAKSMLMAREKDEAMAATWDNNMQCLRTVLDEAIRRLHKEKMLSPEWTPKNATDTLYTLLSIQSWEQYTIECGWSNKKYLRQMKQLVNKLFIRD